MLRKGIVEMFEIKTSFVKLAAVIGVGVCSMRTLAFAAVPDGFVGVWRGGKSGLADESYLVIRDDLTGGAFGVSEEGEEFKSYEFNFAVDEGYVIRGGKICEPVRGATLIGKGHEIMPRISMVGSDWELAAGVCGASSGHVPVTVGQPSIKVDQILVGGR